MQVDFGREEGLAASEFIGLMHRSGLAARRPVDDETRIARMLANSNLVVTARDREASTLIGVARSVTDFAYSCYLSDLAVDRTYHGRGVGRTLIEKTRTAAGGECMCLLLSAPDAMSFYQNLGIAQPANAFLYPRER